ncbi:hypothetical protein ACU686_40165 [Yinghuangia aomiensis]
MKPHEAVEFPYSLGEIVTAAVDAGLAIESLAELVEAELDPRGLLPEPVDGLVPVPRWGRRSCPSCTRCGPGARRREPYLRGGWTTPGPPVCGSPDVAVGRRRQARRRMPPNRR